MSKRSQGEEWNHKENEAKKRKQAEDEARQNMERLEKLRLIETLRKSAELRRQLAECSWETSRKRSPGA